ncbi:hypothetical protein [Pseudohalioglobus lutimaris]|nr:hypothetical protein [Pseudohalioglobus lutimaris]
MAQFHLDTTLACSYESAAMEVKTPSLLMYISHPLLVFEPVNGTVVPEVWEEKTYWFRLKLFGVVPLGTQVLRITFDEENAVFRFCDDGYSRLIRRWYHLIIIQGEGGVTQYRDTLDLKAGIATPFVWLFARVFFAHRQKRLRQIALSGFNYEEAWNL